MPCCKQNSCRVKPLSRHWRTRVNMYSLRSLISIIFGRKAKDDHLNRKYAVGRADTQDHTLRKAHIHVLPRNSPHWQRHIAFRDYLQTHPTVKEEYQALKEKLTKQVWRDGNEYNEAKNAFIKVVEERALKWHQRN